VVEAFTYYAHREPRVAPEAAEPPVLRKARVSAADSRHRSGAFLSAFPSEEGVAARRSEIDLIRDPHRARRELVVAGARTVVVVGRAPAEEAPAAPASLLRHRL